MCLCVCSNALNFNRGREKIRFVMNENILSGEGEISLALLLYARLKPATVSSVSHTIEVLNVFARVISVHAGGHYRDYIDEPEPRFNRAIHRYGDVPTIVHVFLRFKRETLQEINTSAHEAKSLRGQDKRRNSRFP